MKVCMGKERQRQVATLMWPAGNIARDRLISWSTERTYSQSIGRLVDWSIGWLTGDMARTKFMPAASWKRYYRLLSRRHLTAQRQPATTRWDNSSSSNNESNLRNKFEAGHWSWSVIELSCRCRCRCPGRWHEICCCCSRIPCCCSCCSCWQNICVTRGICMWCVACNTLLCCQVTKQCNLYRVSVSCARQEGSRG